MSRVMYDGKRLIPAPLINITKEYQKSGNGEIVGKIYRLTVTGTIVAWMGSPQSEKDLSHDNTGFEGPFFTAGGYPADEVITEAQRLGAIQRKQEAIRELFSNEGLHFEVQSLDGGASVKCNPRILSIEFPEGIWFDRSEYNISMECDELYGDDLSREDTFNQYISEASEEWSIETNEDSAETLGVPKTYALSHSISANGKRFYKDDGTGLLIKEPWEYAKDFVLSKLGFDNSMILSSGVNNLPTYYKGFNHVRNESINKQGGSYAVTENWLLSSGNATENFNVQTSDNIDSPYTRVTINGEIKGYDERDEDLNIINSKWENANDKFASISGLIFIRAQQFSGHSLNISPMSETIAINPFQGAISYTYEYDDRPMNLIEGARSEVINIQDNLNGHLFASVFVLGRVAGPVLQDLGTKEANIRTLSMEVVFYPPTYSDREISTIRNLFITQKPSVNPLYAEDIQNIIDAVNPENNGFTTVFRGQDQETWNPKDGRWTYTTNWTFE